MPFSEPLKLLVRKRAHFRCCVCRAVGVEIHHIVPQEESGPDTQDNAAPLCPSCHEIYGANPTKRKFLREARDFWYEVSASSLSRSGITLSELSTAIEPIATKGDIAEIRELLSQLVVGNSTQTGSAAAVAFEPVPLERVIRALYDEDFGGRKSAYDLLFDSRFWYEPGEDSYDLLDRRAFFLKAFGEETAKRLCLITCKQSGFDSENFSEQDLAEVIQLLHTTVILITQHRKFAGADYGFECTIRSDGESAWRVAPRQKKPGRRVRSK